VTDGQFSIRVVVDQHPQCHLTEVVFGYSSSPVVVPLRSETVCETANDAYLVGDFNFDGRIDVAVVNRFPADNLPVYDYWLQDASGRFDASPSLDNANLIDPVFDAGSREILTTAKANADQVVHRTYRWIGGSLRQTACSVESLSPHIKADPNLCY
jgi:hypothetical protein